MASTRRAETDEVATYEVCLRGSMPEHLRRRCGGMDVQADWPQTVLFRCVRDVSELHTLLDRLGSTGLVLTEVHAAAQTPEARSEFSGHASGTASRYYEVRVRGELGDRLLRYLGWSHRLVADRQVARGEVSAHELSTFLLSCSAAGLAVDRIRRTVTARPPALVQY
jgi:hypothetical protein